MTRIHPIIMAGGRGTRFWPASREARPKQFLVVTGEDSLLRRTGVRLFPLAGPGNVWVVTNAAHVGLVAEHLPEIPPAQILGEPVGRNTAPCVGLAAAMVLREDPDGVLLVAPADHWIGDEDRFREAAELAASIADEERMLVTFGVVPGTPDTGYGYIEAEDGEVRAGVRRVACFKEKPDLETAKGFLASGRHFWNSGIFAWRADVFLEELEQHAPELAAGCRRIAGATDRESAFAEIYPELPSISVDYAVLEHSDRVAVVPASFPWSDIGTWDALSDALPRDDRGNVLEGDALEVDSEGCLVRAGNRLAAIIGLKDVLVIDTPDALLVCPKDRAQDVRRIVERLESDDRRDLL